MLIIFLYICSHICAVRVRRDLIAPLPRYAQYAAAPPIHGLVNTNVISHEGGNATTYVPQEVTEAVAIRCWYYDSYQERLQLYRTCLMSVAESIGIEEMVLAIRQSTSVIGTTLSLFHQVPMLYVLLHREVYGFMSAFHDSLKDKCNDRINEVELRLLDASPRLHTMHKALLKEVEDAYLEVLSLFRLFALPLPTSSFLYARYIANNRNDYWRQVHYKAYINGAKLTLKMALLAMVNKYIFPLLLRQVITVLEKHITFFDVKRYFQLLTFNFQ